MDELFLCQFGFTERESRVYLALLELGTSTVGPIAEKTKIQYAKIYPTMHRLEEKGLITYSIISKTKHFQALDPKYILKGFREKEAKFLAELPKLEAMQQQVSKKPVSEIYEGYNSAKQLFDEVVAELNEGDFYYVFAHRSQYKDVPLAKRTLHNIHMRLEEKKITDKLIAHVDVQKEVTETFADVHPMKIRFSERDIPLGLLITPHCIVLGTWEDKPTYIKITSDKIANQYKLFFESMWQMIGEPDI